MGIKLGLVGLGMFGGQFAKLFKAHPLVDKIALCDCEAAKVKKFLEDPFMADKVSPADCYESLDDICKADLDGIVIITQPWLHAPQCIQVLESGKHVYSAVPVISLPDDNEILDWCAKIKEASIRNGKEYMLGETTIYRPQTMFCRRMAKLGMFGDFVYAEGEYTHDVDAIRNLREVAKERRTGKIGEQAAALYAPYRARGLKGHPMSYPTHSVSGPINVMNTRALKVSAYGTPNTNGDSYFQNYEFSNIAAFYQLANGCSLRIAEFREIGAESIDREDSEIFRIIGKMGSFSRNTWECNHRRKEGEAAVIRKCPPEDECKDLSKSTYCTFSLEEMRDPLPKEVQNEFKKILNPNASPEDDFQPTGHGGSHPYLVHEFVSMIHENRKPEIPVNEAMHYMAMGVAAHKSAQRDGEIVAVEQFD